MDIETLKDILNGKNPTISIDEFYYYDKALENCVYKDSATLVVYKDKDGNYTLRDRNYVLYLTGNIDSVRAYVNNSTSATVYKVNSSIHIKKIFLCKGQITLLRDL